MANNPRILRTFAYTKSSNVIDPERKYDTAMCTFHQDMRDLVRKLLSTMKREEFTRTLMKCLDWLEYAHHNVVLDVLMIRSYKESYLHQENLTYYEKEDGDKFKMKLYIPSVYDHLVDELKRSFRRKRAMSTLYL